MIPNVSKNIKFIPITVLLLASILVGTLTATHAFTSNRTSKIISTTTTRAEHTTKTMSSSTLETSVTTTTLPTTTVSSTSSLSNTTTTSIPPFSTSQSSIGCVSEQTLQAWFPYMDLSTTKTGPLYPQSVDGSFMETNFIYGCYLNKNFAIVYAGTMWQYGIYNGTPTQGIFIVLDFWNVPSSSNIFIPLPRADHEPNPLQIVSVNPQGDVLTLEPLTGPFTDNSHPNPNINYYFSIPLGKFIS